MIEKLLLLFGVSSMSSGIICYIYNYKKCNNDKELNIISTIFMIFGIILSASALDNILKPEEDKEIDYEE